MQIFRAYLQDVAGVVTWAAWIEADSLAAARQTASGLCVTQSPAVDLWWATPRDLGGALEQV